MEGRNQDQTERGFSATNLCRFLVRKGGHRAARTGRRRQHHVGVRLSAYRVDLSAIVELCRGFTRGRARGRAAEDVLRQRTKAVRDRVSTMLNNSFISVDDHVQEHPEVWTKRLSR